MKSKFFRSVMAMLFLVGFSAPAQAATSTATASLTASIPSVTTVAFARDTNSVTRGTATQIVFDKLDSQDMLNGDPTLMYAPYRSEVNKNWHIANVAANGATMVLSMSVTGSVGTTPLSSMLYTWSGGFFAPGATIPISGTNSTDWEFANGWQRSLSSPFTGTVPFNYRLNIGTASAGSFTGTVTLTLTTT